MLIPGHMLPNFQSDLMQVTQDAASQHAGTAAAAPKPHVQHVHCQLHGPACCSTPLLLQVTGAAAPSMLAQLLQHLPPEAASETDQQHILARATQPVLTSTCVLACA